METVSRRAAQEKFDAVLAAMRAAGRSVRKDAHGEDLIEGTQGRAVWLELVQNDDGDWLVGASFDTVTEAEQSYREEEDEWPDRVFPEPATAAEIARVLDDYLG
ncbi:MAG TPA: hypothetical protein VNJ51_02540 [Candidatus Dormibacteraeota bacterium]|nr:hypothetical protein [Candidatus Dormibacteraeota bacterium]